MFVTETVLETMAGYFEFTRYIIDVSKSVGHVTKLSWQFYWYFDKILLLGEKMASYSKFGLKQLFAALQKP